MTIIPAIDILDGKCVRLTRGDYSAVSVYGEDPVAVSERFVEVGAGRIHIVDLDAARGSGNNRAVIAEIRRKIGVTIEVGGGVREDADIASLVDAGVNRIVVGTVLARDPDRVARWCNRHGPVVVAGIDALDGVVHVAGWQTGTDLRDTDLARTAKTLGCISIIYTSIARDGMLEGPDIERTNAVAAATDLPIILSGGISSREDIDRVSSQAHPSVRGIVVGKALYAGRIDLAAVLERYAVVDSGTEAREAW